MSGALAAQCGPEYDGCIAKRKATITLDDEKLQQVRELLGEDTVSGTIDTVLSKFIRRARNERDARIYANARWTEEELNLQSYVQPYVEIDDDDVWEQDYAQIIVRHRPSPDPSRSELKSGSQPSTNRAPSSS